MLDVAFNEDNSMKRAGNAAENFSVITKIVLNAVKQSELKKGNQSKCQVQKENGRMDKRLPITAILTNAH